MALFTEDSECILKELGLACVLTHAIHPHVCSEDSLMFRVLFLAEFQPVLPATPRKTNTN